ncbi:hypothetical protein [Candidatus Phaeomarinobacter ectocarpi]|nr:hypothetical protein [Candidatus Phaeomarinobacter ectocarpi]
MSAAIDRLVSAQDDSNLQERDFRAEMRELRGLVQEVRALEARPPSDNVVTFQARKQRPHDPWNGGAA